MDIIYYVLIGIKGFFIVVGFLLSMVLFLGVGSLVGKLMQAGSMALKGEKKDGGS